MSICILALMSFECSLQLANTKEAKKKIGSRDEGSKKASEALRLFQSTLDLFFRFPKAETLNEVIGIADKSVEPFL